MARSKQIMLKTHATAKKKKAAKAKTKQDTEPSYAEEFKGLTGVVVALKTKVAEREAQWAATIKQYNDDLYRINMRLEMLSSFLQHSVSCVFKNFLSFLIS